MKLAAVSSQKHWSIDEALVLCLLYYPSGLLPLSVTLSLSFIKQQGHRAVCFLLAASSVLRGHSAALQRSRTGDWTWHGSVARGTAPSASKRCCSEATVARNISPAVNHLDDVRCFWGRTTRSSPPIFIEIITFIFLTPSNLLFSFRF